MRKKLNQALRVHYQAICASIAEIPSFPRLWDGAWSEFERYTTRDLEDIVE
jgi:hypothetical protein